MTNLILEEMKLSLGILNNNIGFDTELLLFSNSIKSSLVQLGVVEMDIDINENTTWPVWQNDKLGGFVKHYMQVKLRQTFDPTASETMAKTLAASASELEDRIINEVAEVPYV